MTRPPMIVATMASLSSREKLLEQTVASLLPQVDALCVYLNGYDQIPRFLRHPKVLHAVLSKEAGWRGAEAKLWFWDRDEFKAAPAWRDDDVALICDDDIIYPPDYAARMVAALDERPGTIACVHGSIMMEPFVSYVESRWVARAGSEIGAPARVHIPGTGTMAFRRGTLDFRLGRDVTWSHCVDVMAALAAKRQGVEVWSVARGGRWLQPMPLPKDGTGIFKQRVGAGVADVETKLLQDAAPWPVLDIATVGIVPRIHRGPAPKRNVNSMLPAAVAPWLAEALRGARGVVVELGSGHGSAPLAAALPEGCRLVSVEHDERFIALVPGLSYIHAPIVDGWYDAARVRASLPPPAEIAAVVIDGPPRAIGRAGVLCHLERLGDGPIVVDDAHRPADLEIAREIARRRGVELTVHDGGGGRAFATVPRAAG